MYNIAMNIFGFLTIKSEISCLYSDSTVRQALEKMDSHKYSVIPMIDKDGKYAGTVSEGDLLRFIKNDCDFDINKGEDEIIEKIEKHRSYKALDISSSIEELLDLSMDQNFIPIVDDRNVFIGIVKRKTILNYFKKEMLSSLEKFK